MTIVDIVTQNIAAATAAPMIDRYAPAARPRLMDADLSLMSIVPTAHATGHVSFAGASDVFAVAKNAATPAWAPPPRREPL